MGKDYKVINLATRGGKPGELANIAAEYLLKKRRKVIYIADGSARVFSVDYNYGFYVQTVYQGWLGGYLFDWAPRDRILRSEWMTSTKIRGPALGALLDAKLNFLDLWNYVSVEYGSFVWNKLLGTDSFSARKYIADSEFSPEELDKRRYTLPFDREMEIVEGEVLRPGETLSASIEDTENTFPPQLRASTLALIHLESPYYRSKLSDTDQRQLVAQAAQHAKLLETIGIRRAISCSKDFNEDDYLDRVHLSYRGGNKLAAIVAPEVINMAKSLGYSK